MMIYDYICYIIIKLHITICDISDISRTSYYIRIYTIRIKYNLISAYNSLIFKFTY